MVAAAYLIMMCGRLLSGIGANQSVITDNKLASIKANCNSTFSQIQENENREIRYLRMIIILIDTEII